MSLERRSPEVAAPGSFDADARSRHRDRGHWAAVRIRAALADTIPCTDPADWTVHPGFARALDRLTRRQREVLALMATGYTNVAIARHLVISTKAVVQHTSQIYERLDLFEDDDVHRRVRAVVQYLTGVAA